MQDLPSSDGRWHLRDVLLGCYPLIRVQKPSYLALTAGAAFVTILIARKWEMSKFGFNDGRR